MHGSKGRLWYQECSDRCGHCFKLPKLLMKDKGTKFKFICKLNCDGNQIEWRDKLVEALCEWNIKQRKIRGKI